MNSDELKDHLHGLIDGITDESVLRSVYILLSASALRNDEDWLKALPAKIQEHLIYGILNSEGIDPADHQKVLKELAEKYPELNF